MRAKAKVAGSRKVGRPPTTRHPAATRRQQILDAAIEEFAYGGFREVGTASIARRVGVTEPTLYRHFASKRDLYLAAIEQSITVIMEAWRTLATGDANPLDALRAIGLWSLDEMRREPRNLRLRARALVETGQPDAIDRLRAHFAESQKLIRDLYERARADGLLPAAVDVQARAWAFMSIGALLDQTHLLHLDAQLGLDEMGRLIASVAPELLGGSTAAIAPAARRSTPP